MSDQIKADMADLLSRPQFRRFLWRVVERGGIFTTATSGTDNANLSFAEGRRSMALEIMMDAEAGQDMAHPTGLPLIASIQTLNEEVQMPQRDMETKRGRRRRSDEYRDLDDGSTGGRSDDRAGRDADE